MRSGPVLQLFSQVGLVTRASTAKIATINSINSAAQKPLHRLLEDKFIALLQSCKSPKQLHQIQSQLVTHGLQHNPFTTSKLIRSFAQLNKLTYARKVFDQIHQPKNTSLWNSLLKGYLQNHSYRDVIVLFCQMRGFDVMPNCYTFPLVLKSCVMCKAVREGEEVHCFAVKSGFKGNAYVGTVLIEMYSVEGVVGDAYKVFGEMTERNVVAWTMMVKGFILSGDLGSARQIFDLAPERDVVLWNIMVAGYIGEGDMVGARKLFNEMPNQDVMSWNTMLNGYANNGDVESCEGLFEEMTERNIFSWNGLIGGYAHNGRYFEVLSAFNRMLVEGDVVPNDATLVTVLTTCARLGALDLGKWVQVYAHSNGYKGNIYVGNALVDMYAKCGVIKNAMEVFKSMDKKDLISWNTILGGLAVHGHGVDALNLFNEMIIAGEQPDGVTFLAILCACTHMGLVEQGFSYFQSMINEYNIVPQIEHYGCMVDLLAKAGQLDRAIDFVRKMPMEADAVIWASLLSACRTHKNVELAEVALQRLIELEPNNPANFVMLANIYGDIGRWKDVARLKLAMRDTRSRKIPGCSLIEVNDQVSEFYSLDERHHQSEKIYDVLRGLTKVLKSHGYVPDLHYNNVYHQELDMSVAS